MDPLFWAFGLLLLGLVLVVLEVFIPSGGALGVMAALAILGAVGVAFLGGLQSGAIVLGVTALAVPAVLLLAVKYWPHSPLGRLILIKLPKSDREILPLDERGDLKQLVGKLGRARSKMLPSGIVSIDGRSYDAVSQGTPIDPGETVKVVAVRNNRIVVRTSSEQLPPPPRTPQLQEQSSEEELLSRPIDALGLDPLDDPLA